MLAGYTTAVESQTLLAAYADWLALTDAQQDTYLEWGRVFLDANYTCLNMNDDTDASDNLKMANALTGYMHLQGTLFAEHTEIDSESVAAGDVSSSTTYKSGSGTTTRDVMHHQVRQLLVDDCTARGAVSGMNLTRV